MQLADRHVEGGAVGVLQLHQLGFAFAQAHGHQADVAADAVLFVHHRIAGLDFGQVAQHGVGTGARALAAGMAARHVLVELGFSDHGDAGVGQHEAGIERGHGQRQRHAAGEEFRPVVHRARLDAVLLQELMHGFAAAQAFHRDQDALLATADEGVQQMQRVVGAALHRQRRQRRAAGGQFAVAGQLDAGIGLEPRHQFVRAQEDVGRRQHRRSVSPRAMS